jgi:3-hydroxyisobutyrate dehydrogenase
MNAVPERVGLIGLGNMGRPMGRRIAAGGYALTVHDLDPARIAAFRAEVPAARAADSAAAAGAASDILVTMLPDGQAVREALLGAAGALPALTAGATVIDMSSSSPLGTRQLGAELARHGVHLVDAPVSGGVGCGAPWTGRCRSWPAATRRRSSACSRCSARWAP